MVSSARNFLSRDKDQILNIIENFYQDWCFSDSSWRPIEDFKRPSRNPRPQNWAKTFTSSGTTSTQKSQSHFSGEGLALYKYQAISAFYEQLEKRRIHDPKIISLVPTCQTWSDSSLAQMIAWLGEFWTVEYTSIDDVPCALQKNGTVPMILFATGFHLVTALDKLQPFKVSENTWIMETGGTKGRTREISKKALYEELARKLAVRADHIISEYGMAELACQAYLDSDMANRYCFPQHVRVFVETAYKRFETAGIGSLTVLDPLRIDVQEPIRTQDVVRLERDGSFELIGRAESAPLKGCSLPFEPSPVYKRPESVHSIAIQSPRSLSHLAEAMFSFFSRPSTLKQLEKELGNKALARQGIKDIRRALPKGESELRSAMTRSGLTPQTACKWVVIAPATHSLAILYPTFFLAAHGCSVKVRLPNSSEVANSIVNFTSFLRQSLKLDVATLPATWRLEESKDTDHEIFAFASNETISTMRRGTDRFIRAFGTALGCTFIRDASEIGPACDDLFALRRRGCMSSRILFIQDDLSQRDLTSGLNSYLEQREIRPSPLEKAGARCDALALEQREWSIFELIDCLVARKRFDARAPIESYLAAATFLLPVVQVADEVHFFNWFSEQAKTRADHLFTLSATRLTFNFLPDNLVVSNLSDMNAPIWDGTLFKQPLFL